MSADSAKSNCLDARPHYYDYLSEQTRGGIPKSALDHITRCASCQNNIDRLRNLIENSVDKHSRRQNQKDKAVIELLGLHLGYAGKPVKCGTAKQFIASLADPLLQIRVETPITKHIDKCPACRDDLRYLEDLQLSHGQLCRLGQLLAYMPETYKVSCAQAHSAIDPAASMAFHDTDSEQLKHLCTCPDCRYRLYQRREDIRNDLLQDGTVEGKQSCESITTRAVFDFSVPYGIEPGSKNFVESQERLASHLRSCPRCLDRIQSLHENIYHIAERPDSGVVTCFILHDEGVPTVNSIEEPDYARIIPAAVALKLKRRISALNLKQYAKLAVAAAAVIIIYALLSGAPPVQALDPTIVRAFTTADNVHIIMYDTGRTEPRWEKWVSRSLGVYLQKNGEQFSLSIIPDRVRITRKSQNDVIQEKVLTGDGIAVMREKINGTLGITPFNNMSDLHPESQWAKFPGETLGITEEDIEVHELTFRDNLDFNRVRFSRWRFFVDAETSRPNKVQIECRYGPDEDYELQSEFKIRYPSESEVKAAIEY